jgi:predicted nuclease of restriction endonuclease-like (RecB) superfamily
LAKELIPRQEYETLLGALKERIRSAQLEALRSVNRGQISLYLDIGRMIVERQQGDTWGKGIVDNLSGDLRKEFPGANGFSAANLWRMKNFYEVYCGDEKLAPLVREIGWSHNIAILEKCKSELEREFYIRSCRKYGWSRNVLIHQIESQAFHRTMNNQTNFGAVLDPGVSVRQQLALTLLEPADAGVALALRAVPVAARVVGDGRVSAAGALVAMAAESGRPTARDRGQYLLMLTVDPSAAAFHEALPDVANDVGHLHRGAAQALRKAPPCDSSASASSGLEVALRCLLDRCR